MSTAERMIGVPNVRLVLFPFRVKLLYPTFAESPPTEVVTHALKLNHSAVRSPEQSPYTFDQDF